MSKKNKRTWLKSQAAVIAGACILAVSSASVVDVYKRQKWVRLMNNIKASAEEMVLKLLKSTLFVKLDVYKRQDQDSSW